MVGASHGSLGELAATQVGGLRDSALDRSSSACHRNSADRDGGATGFQCRRSGSLIVIGQTMGSETETRYLTGELRLDGRALSGIALRYADEARLPWGIRERFAPGAFRNLDDSRIMLTEMHDRGKPLARVDGGGLRLEDSSEALRLSADLPKTRLADDVIELIRTRVYRGLSIEFRAVKEAMLDKVRVVESADLLAVSVVDVPAYPQSTIAAMRARFAVQDEDAPPPSARFWL